MLMPFVSQTALIQVVIQSIRAAESHIHVLVQDEDDPQYCVTSPPPPVPHMRVHGPLPHTTFMPSQDEVPVHVTLQPAAPQKIVVSWQVEVSLHVMSQLVAPSQRICMSWHAEVCSH